MKQYTRKTKVHVRQQRCRENHDSSELSKISFSLMTTQTGRVLRETRSNLPASSHSSASTNSGPC